MDVERIFRVASAIKDRREKLAIVKGEIATLEQKMQKLVLSNGAERTPLNKAPRPSAVKRAVKKNGKPANNHFRAEGPSEGTLARKLLDFVTFESYTTPKHAAVNLSIADSNLANVMLANLCKEGHVLRIGRGVYHRTDQKPSPAALVVVALRDARKSLSADELVKVANPASDPSVKIKIVLDHLRKNKIISKTDDNKYECII